MNENIQNFISTKRVALVGASRQGSKFGNSVLKELTARGFEVLVVHPQAETIDGVRTYPNLAAVAGQTERVIVVVPPAQAEDVLREAAAAGIRQVWQQQGAQSPQTDALAQQLGLSLVSGKCILMYAPPVASVHKFHGLIMKLVGQY